MPGLKRVRFAVPPFYPSTGTSSSTREYAPPFGYSTRRTGFDRRAETFHSRSPRIHDLLAYSRHPIIHFDVGLPPTSITSSYTLSRRAMSEPAIEPPVASLTLSIPHVMWPIIVTPSNGVFVSVADVFDAIYHTLRAQVTEREYRSIRSPSDLKRVNAAYEHRHRRIRDGYAAHRERQGGVRRIDFLAGHTYFKGLSTSGSRRSLTLNLS
ncbi:hypothetical protein VKT23_016515 [Stygiomarasmius scandens]|uniref:DUF6699 domain-containing protein n=1 Tax=Marasmiellus scandens TaxID=2682957 RepID=A0ABR1IYQ2_9AGAR